LSFRAGLPRLPEGSEAAFREVRGGFRGAGLVRRRRNVYFACPGCVRGELLGLSHQPPWPWCRNTQPSRPTRHGPAFSFLQPSARPSCPSRLLRRHQPVCAVLLISLDSCVPPKLPAVISRDFQTSSLEIFQRSPLRCLLLHESSPSSSIRRLIRLRPDVAKHRTPSALVVPPDSDGLLLTEPCRFVAPCFQPWGSSRFLPRIPLPVLQPSAVLVAFPELAAHTLRSVSLIDSRIASPQPLPSSLFNRCLPRSPSTPKCFSLPLPACDPLPLTHVATSVL